MTGEISDSIQDLASKIAKELDDFEIRLIAYQEKVRKALLDLA